MKLDVVVSPALIDKHDLEGRVCIVVDVLRATSTITVALHTGAAAVRPCLSIDEAKSEAARNSRSLLGGEEMGTLIPGFDLGNSPFEYMDPGFLDGKTIFFYTTNGSGAIRNARERSQRRVYIGSLLNLSALVSKVVTDEASKSEEIAVLCSGRAGKLSAEDLFCAGLITERIAGALGEAGRMSDYTDSASVAVAYASSKRGQSLQVLRDSEHGRYLDSLGFSKDLEYTSRIDAFETVPIFDGSLITAKASLP